MYFLRFIICTILYIVIFLFLYILIVSLTIVNLICNEKHSTIKTAEQFEIPLKTVEKWITAYNKDNRCFDSNYKTQSQIIDDLKRQVSKLKKDNDILKKTITLLAKKD